MQPCVESEKWVKKVFIIGHRTCPRVYQIQDLCRKKCKKGIFSDVQWWKNNLTHFSDSTRQECMVFAKIGHGSGHHHWNEIFAGVKHQEAPRGLKNAQIWFLPPLMIKIYHFHATWVMPQSFVQIHPNWNEMENSAKRTKRGSEFKFSTFND